MQRFAISAVPTALGGRGVFVMVDATRLPDQRSIRRAPGSWATSLSVRRSHPKLVDFAMVLALSALLLSCPVQTTGAKPRPATMRTTVRMAKRDWLAVHGAKYR